MMSEWKEVRLGDYIKTNLKSIDKNYNFQNILYLDTGSITANKVEGLQNYSLHSAPSRAKRLVKVDDIIYSSVRPNQLHYGFIKNPEENLVVSTGFVVITCSIQVVYPKFIYYYLTSDRLTQYLHTIAEASTSAYPSLKPSDIEDLILHLPPLKEQKAIAEVLSSLDDKIDLLHRQNKTLETLAETIFRQTFIEQANENWEEKPLSSIATFLNGLACQKFPPENNIDKLPVLKIKELRGGFSADCDWSSSKISSDYIVNSGDIIFSWSASLMVKIWDGGNCILNQHLFKVTSEKFPKWFYYLWSKHYLTEFISISKSHATTMGHIKRKDLDNAMVLIPSDSEIKTFSEIQNPIIEKIINNNKKVNTLEKLRDTLLPKLMSGKARVKL